MIAKVSLMLVCILAALAIYVLARDLERWVGQCARH